MYFGLFCCCFELKAHKLDGELFVRTSIFFVLHLFCYWTIYVIWFFIIQSYCHTLLMWHIGFFINHSFKINARNQRREFEKNAIANIFIEFFFLPCMCIHKIKIEINECDRRIRKICMLPFNIQLYCSLVWHYVRCIVYCFVCHTCHTFLKQTFTSETIKLSKWFFSSKSFS